MNFAKNRLPLTELYPHRQRHTKHSKIYHSISQCKPRYAIFKIGKVQFLKKDTKKYIQLLKY